MSVISERTQGDRLVISDNQGTELVCASTIDKVCIDIADDADAVCVCIFLSKQDAQTLGKFLIHWSKE